MVKVIALKDITDQFKPDLAGKDLTYFRDLSIPVSYTHLTLPTKQPV